MRKLGSAAAVVLTGLFLALSLGGPAGSRRPAERAFVPADMHRAQTTLASAQPRVLKSGHPVRHDDPPVAPFRGPATLPEFRFTEAPARHPVTPGQLRPASFAFSLYPTGPPARR
jgi:hypothetical protein